MVLSAHDPSNAALMAPRRRRAVGVPPGKEARFVVILLSPIGEWELRPCAANRQRVEFILHDLAVPARSIAFEKIDSPQGAAPPIGHGRDGGAIRVFEAQGANPGVRLNMRRVR